MEAITQILILASPGHYRDSLVALLRTIPYTEFTFLDSSSYETESLCRADPSTREISSIILVDMDSVLAMPPLGKGVISSLTRFKSSWFKARMIVMVDNLQHTREAQRVGADVILPRGISAGEFLRIVQDLITRQRRLTKLQPTVSLPSFVNLQRSGSPSR